MTTAAVAAGTAGGLRAWLAIKAPAWMTPKRLKAVSALLVGGAVLAAGLTPG